MKKTLVLLLTVVTFSAFAVHQEPTIWQATFHDIMPNQNNVTTSYCKTHSPDVFTTTVKNILGKGAVAKNGVRTKYLNYKQSTEHGLHFIRVNAYFSGNENGKPWKLRAWLYEQTLTPNSTTDVVWSTGSCKGKFTGNAINLH